MQKTARFYTSLFLIGITAGLVGVVLTHLLHFIQSIAFSYGENGVDTFREAAQLSSGWQRWIVLTLCGAVVGFGWFALHRLGAPLISVNKSLEKPLTGVPFFTTCTHALLQIITVGLGSPLGREVAPREMAVAFASAFLRKYPLTSSDAKLLLACASGAGLTAVYNVPLAATIFILETMLLGFSARALVASMVTVGVATCTSRFFLGDLVQYSGLPDLNVPPILLGMSLVIGFFMGIGANLFQSTAKQFPKIPRDSQHIIWFAIWAFSMIGLLSLIQPEILGNGKAGNQLTFWAMIGLQESLVLMALKWVAVLLALAAGAYGGLITPSMMLGSTLAYALALSWNALFPAYIMPADTVAVIGAGAFLGVSLKMPLTAVAFLLELTRSNAQMLMPLCLAMGAATLTDYIWNSENQQASS